MNQSSPCPFTKRPRLWRRLALVLLFLVLVSGSIFFYFHWTASSELNGLIAELDRLDPGWRLEDIEAKRKVVPDTDNSALQVLLVKKMQGGQPFLTPAMGTIFDDMPNQVQLNEPQIAYLKKRFAVVGKAVLEARKLKDMPEGRLPIQSTSDYLSTSWSALNTLQTVREAMSLLQYDSFLRGPAADAVGAMESCLALQNTTRSIGDEPFLMAGMVRYAGNSITAWCIERALAQCHFSVASEPVLKTVQENLAKEIAEPTLMNGLRGERAGMHQYFTALAEGKTTKLYSYPSKKKGTVSISNTIETTLNQLPGFNTRYRAAHLGFFNEAVEALKLPPEQCEEKFQIFEMKAQGEPNQVRQLIAPIVKMRGADLRTQAKLRCALAGIAAERFRLAKNRWPESLDILVKTGFLDAVPADPYDNQPLRLKPMADGLIIYSIGPDRIDNNGLIDINNPIAPGTDLVFRLWNPRYRRQPANPPVAGEFEDLSK